MTEIENYLKEHKIEALIEETTEWEIDKDIKYWNLIIEYPDFDRQLYIQHGNDNKLYFFT